MGRSKMGQSKMGRSKMEPSRMEQSKTGWNMFGIYRKLEKLSMKGQKMMGKRTKELGRTQILLRTKETGLPGI